MLLQAGHLLCAVEAHGGDEKGLTFFISVCHRQLNSIIVSAGRIWSIPLSQWQRERMTCDFRKVTVNPCSAVSTQGMMIIMGERVWKMKFTVRQKLTFKKKHLSMRYSYSSLFLSPRNCCLLVYLYINMFFLLQEFISAVWLFPYWSDRKKCQLLWEWLWCHKQKTIVSLCY